MSIQGDPDLSVCSSFQDEETNTGTNTATGSDSNNPQLAQRETRLVKRLRCLAYSVLLLVAITASVGVYWYSQNEEATTFQSEFQGHGLKVIASFQEDATKKLQTLASLSSELTRYAISKEMKWPFVTVSQSSYLLEPYLSLGDFAAIQVHPIVPAELRDVWETYSVENQHWIQEDLQAKHHLNGTFSTVATDNTYNNDSAIAPYIKNYVGIDTSPGEWIPFWQYAPVIPNRWFINFNRLAWKGFQQEANTVKQKKATLSPSWIFEPGLDLQSTRDFQFTDQLLRAGGFEGNYESEPLSYIHYPVTADFEDDSTTSAILSATVYWTGYFSDILPDGVKGIVCVVENNQGQAFSYEINGRDASFLGMQDLHESEYDDMELSAVYSNFSQDARYTGVPVDDQRMSYSIRVYPSSAMQDDYYTYRPWLYSLSMLFMFLFTASIILLYDRYVEQRQQVVLHTAEKSTAVVASLFPKTVRDRVLEEATGPSSSMEASSHFRKAGFKNTAMGDSSERNHNVESSIIADFFPEATVLFSDIQGFTAWCSAREPAQVFALLEALYGSFDRIAKRRKIFKVETIGDCYVACAGCPTPRSDHAVAVARFAKDCLIKMDTVFKRLELSLGPGTGDLTMRFGIHSGPVTGGVVRGENARFQLFGDTMNVAARMESNGVAGRVHLSKDTADLLTAAGRSNWIEKREDKIKAKGKEGLLQTYWLKMSAWNKSIATTDSSVTDYETNDFEHIVTDIERERRNRLIDWNTDVLVRCLKQIVAQRKAQGRKVSTSAVKAMEKKHFAKRSTMPFDEVCEVIPLPQRTAGSQWQTASVVPLDDNVIQQARSLVENICSMYRSNPFHSFDHASSVVASVKKLLSRITDPRLEDVDDGESLHDHTFGITSHPLTQFAVVFSALIHDVDHVGIPNAQLVKEGADVAIKYQGKSVAEQNSVDLAFDLLMKDQYADLRATIYGNKTEMTHFRQLVVNCVLATDIVDKDLKSLRNKRWEKAFSDGSVDNKSTGTRDLEDTNRRATIVLEHLIQASDIAHTMQHWHVYRQWNRRLFEEMYLAYKQGRSEKDPSEFWYKGEIGFFDFYIIPLAKKLKECGVFGVCSAEYLDYAMKNRAEWAEKGESVVAEIIAETRAKYEFQHKMGKAGSDFSSIQEEFEEDSSFTEEMITLSPWEESITTNPVDC